METKYFVDCFESTLVIAEVKGYYQNEKLFAIQEFEYIINENSQVNHKEVTIDALTCDIFDTLENAVAYCIFTYGATLESTRKRFLDAKREYVLSNSNLDLLKTFMEAEGDK